MIEADRLAHASRWRGLPLAEKALLSLGLLALAMALPPWPGSAMVLVVASLCAWRAGTGTGAWVRLLAVPLAFVLTGAATLLVQVGPDGPTWAEGGVPQAARLALRATAAAAALLLLAVTTPMAALVQGLRRLGLPADLAELVLVIYRFIFVLLDTASAMHASQVARLGGDGWRRRVRSTSLLAAALWPRALDRARRLEVGLAARGFDGALPTLAAGPPVAARPWRLLAVLSGLMALTGVSLWI